MGTSIQRSSSETHLHKRGVSFNIPGEEVDGMDVVAVREAGKRAVEHARKGNGPTLLEMKTYRYRGHSMSDPAKYRTKEEVDEVQKAKRDPIDHVKKLIIDAGYAERRRTEGDRSRDPRHRHRKRDVRPGKPRAGSERTDDGHLHRCVAHIQCHSRRPQADLESSATSCALALDSRSRSARLE
jgi:TPP-dependent pyruvate/acetoin dehydrogenase alpha subunit